MRARAALLAVLVLAAVLRLAGIGREGLWSDECTTDSWTRLPVPELVRRAALDNHPPLYFLAEKGLAAAAGRSEAALRLLSAVASCLTVALAFRVARELGGTDLAGLWAALLLAVLPSSVHYAREARSYALLSLLVLAIFDRARSLGRHPSARSAVLLALPAAALLWTHNAGALYLAGAVLPALFAGGSVRAGDGSELGAGPHRRARAMSPRHARLLAAALVAALYAPWLPSLARQVGEAGASFAWAEALFRAEYPYQVPLSLAALQPAAPGPIRNRIDDPGLAAWTSLCLVLVLVLGLAWKTARTGDDADAGPEGSTRFRVLALVGAAAVLPLLLLFAASALGRPLYVVGRAEAPLAPLAAVAIALVLAALPRPAGWTLVLAAVAAATPGLAAEIRGESRSWERSILQPLGELRAAREPVVATTLLACIERYTGAVPGRTLFAFPSERELHPDWVGPSRPDAASLAADARATVDRVLGALDAAESGPRRVWLLSDTGPDAIALASELERRLAIERSAETAEPPLWLRSYVERPAAAAGAPGVDAKSSP